jgi:hypothetical protein
MMEIENVSVNVRQQHNMLILSQEHVLILVMFPMDILGIFQVAGVFFNAWADMETPLPNYVRQLVLNLLFKCSAII